MNTIVNAAPMSRMRGIRDLSGRAVDNEPAVRPTHLPHVFIYGERGSTDPELLIGAGLAKMYGARSFDFRGPYANHQTKIATTANGNGNAVLVQRIVPEDAAPKAGLCLYLEILETTVPVFVRDVGGAVVTDAAGNSLYENAGAGGDLISDGSGGYVEASDGTTTGTPVMVAGRTAKWVVGSLPQYNSDGDIITQAMIDAGGEEAVAVSNALGQQSPADGDLVDNDLATTGMRYPILELEAAWVGEYGNRLGVRLASATARSAQPQKESVYLNEKTVTGRLQFVERPVNASTAQVTQTSAGEQSIEFALKPGAIDASVEKELYLGDVAITSYDDGIYASPFVGMHVYQDNIDAILAEVFDIEAPEQDSMDENDTDESKYMINLLDGLDFDGNPYNTFRLLGPLDDAEAVNLNSVATHYATGGSDGTMSFTDHANQVGVICESYAEGDWDFLDDAIYPQSVIYDSGFPIDVKKKLFVPMGVRKDIVTVIATQDVSQPQNSVSDDSSAASALRAAARLYPESEIYGTSTCRALVMGRSGKLLNDPYKDLLPLTIEACHKFSAYMGAGDRVWKPNAKFDDPANNKVELFDPRTVVGAYVPATQRAKDWDTGMISVQNYNRDSLFVPAWQTVYDDDTSVLNSAANMWVAVELEKICQEVWRELTGIGYLNEAQFIQRSNRLIEARAKESNFDNRVVIEVETFKTPADTQRGYSWSTNVTMYANNMQTVGTYTVIARRMSDLAA